MQNDYIPMDMRSSGAGSGVSERADNLAFGYDAASGGLTFRKMEYGRFCYAVKRTNGDAVATAPAVR